MTGSHSPEVNQQDEEDWVYFEPEGVNVQMENIANAGLEEPRVAVSKYIPLIEYNSDEQTFSITTKLR